MILNLILFLGSILFLFLGSIYFALQIGNDITSKMNRKKRIEEALKLVKLVCPPLPADKEKQLDNAINDVLKNEQ